MIAFFFSKIRNVLIGALRVNLSFSDSIEANVEHAEIHVSEGTQQLRKARDYQVYTNPYTPKLPS